MTDPRSAVRRRLAGGLCLVILGAVLRAQEPGPTTRPAPKPGAEAPEAHKLPDITIVGKKPPIEQGRRSLFTDLPPRDLMARPLTESPGLDTATSVVGQEEIRWLDAYSVVDALRYVPGAWTETRGRKVKQFFSVRGQRYPYPGYLIDGAWFREFHETNYFLSAANIERIEVLRSSASLLLSPGGMTGLINIVPRTYTKMATQIDTLFGSDCTARVQLSHGNAIKRLSYAVGLGYRTTDGGPDHINAEENITNFYGRVVTKPVPEWTFSLSALSFFGDRELKLAEPPASGALQTRRDSFDPMHTYLFVGKARYEPSDRAATEILVNYALRRFHGHRPGTADWLEKDYEYGARIVQSLKLGDHNVLRLAGMCNHWVSPTGKRFYHGRRGDLWTYAGAVVDEHEFGKLRVNAGYRFARTYLSDFGGFDVEGSASGLASVRVHEEWEDPLHTFTLGASYALRHDYSLHANASWGQLSAQPGMMTVDLARPGTETRTKLDLGIQRNWDRFGKVALTGFYVHQKDAPLLTSAFVTVDGVDYGLYESADRENYGLELDVRTKRFDSGFQFFFNAVAMQTRRQGDGGWRGDREVPEFILGGGVSWLFKDLELSLLVKRVCPYENERFLPGGSDPAPLGDYTDVTAKATYYFGHKKQHSVFFGVENLCNDQYSTVAGYPDEGIRFKGGLSLRF